ACREFRLAPQRIPDASTLRVSASLAGALAPRHDRANDNQGGVPMRCIRLLATSGVVALAVSTPALAQQYPSKPITVIVPFAAGGPTDVVARLLGEHMGRTLHQTFIVENIGGAGG